MLLLGRNAQAQESGIPLPSATFEDAKPATVSASLRPMTTPQGEQPPTTPQGWNAYQWGANQKQYSVMVESGAGRTGGALRARNIDAEARGGAYTHVALKPGMYRLSVWAKTAPGQTSTASMYLANRYSRPLRVTQEWKRFTLTTDVPDVLDRAEINVQNSSGQADDIWFDDIELTLLKPVRISIVPDNRKQRPRSLLFSPINVNYLRETAGEWATRGFRGFLFDGVMHDTTTNVWAVDGNAGSRGEDDGLFREVMSCNDACRAVGIDSNFIKVAFYSELPNPFDDEAWSKITSNFAEAATFAKGSGCAGLAIDTEYVSWQYNPQWKGYADLRREPAEIEQQYRRRFQQITKSMLERFPDMVLLTLPEGVRLYRRYYLPIFMGMLQGFAEANAPGGLHVLTEETYHTTTPTGLGNYAEDLNELVLEVADAPYRDYWKARCSIALGAWPLGYYRPIFDDKGKQIGYGGRKEIHGDKVIGSYADRSAWYPPETFRRQMAGLNTWSTKYNWIYAHGPVFWTLTEEQMTRYKTGVHKPMGDMLPTVDNLAEYFDAITHPGFVTRD